MVYDYLRNDSNEDKEDMQVRNLANKKEIARKPYYIIPCKKCKDVEQFGTGF